MLDLNAAKKMGIFLKHGGGGGRRRYILLLLIIYSRSVIGINDNRAGCFLMQESRPDDSKEGAFTCSMWSETMRELAVSVDVTEGMCMRQGFLASCVYQVCLQAGASSLFSSRPEIITIHEQNHLTRCDFCLLL